MQTFLTFTIIGTVTGCLYALTASGLVVTYTTSGIFNFAHGAIGMVAAFLYWQFDAPTSKGGWGWPSWLSLLVVLGVAAPLFGALVERVLIRPLRGAPVDLTLVITLGLLLFLIGVANIAWKPQRIRVAPQFFAGNNVRIAGIAISYNQLTIIIVAILVAIAMRLFFSRTRIGVAMRAVVDNPDLVAMSGASPERIQQLSWALGATLAALAGILLAPIQTLNVLTLTLVVINGYCAAMVGRLRSLPLTIVGALAIGLGTSYAVAYVPDLISLFGLSGEGGIAKYLLKIQLIIPMILLFIVLIVLPQDRLRLGRAPTVLAPPTASLRSSLIGAGGLVVLMALLGPHLSGEYMTTAQGGVALGCILLSLVVLTGYGGLVSLCHMTFVGLGAYAMGTWGKGGSIKGLLLAPLLAAVFGMVVALPTLKMRGLYLALATLAFAQAMDTMFFNEILGTGGELRVDRVRLPGLERTDLTYLMVCTVVFAAMAVGVLAMRRGKWGRRLSALDDSPAACATLGLNINWTKLAVFGASAAMAGFGGALYAAVPGQVSPDDFLLLQSLVLLLLARIGGITTVTGALVSGMFFVIFPVVTQHNPWLGGDIQFLLTGLGALALGRDPYGMGGRIYRAGQRLRRSDRARPPAPSREEDALVAA